MIDRNFTVYKTAKKTFEQNCSNILTNGLVLSHVRGSGGP